MTCDFYACLSIALDRGGVASGRGRGAAAAAARSRSSRCRRRTLPSPIACGTSSSTVDVVVRGEHPERHLLLLELGLVRSLPRIAHDPEAEHDLAGASRRSRAR